MITLEQVRLLEAKIEAAVQKISALGKDNASLQGMCDEFDQENTRLQGENTRLQGEVSRVTAELAALKASQSQYQAEREQLEQVVLHAIERLEAVETTVLETVVSKAEWESAPVPHSEPTEHVDVRDSELESSTLDHVRDSELESSTLDHVRDSELESPALAYVPFGAPRPEAIASAAVEIATFTPGDSGVGNDAEPQDTLDLF